MKKQLFLFFILFSTSAQSMMKWGGGKQLNVDAMSEDEFNERMNHDGLTKEEFFERHKAIVNKYKNVNLNSMTSEEIDQWMRVGVDKSNNLSEEEFEICRERSYYIAHGGVSAQQVEDFRENARNMGKEGYIPTYQRTQSESEKKSS